MTWRVPSRARVEGARVWGGGGTRGRVKLNALLHRAPKPARCLDCRAFPRQGCQSAPDCDPPIAGRHEPGQARVASGCPVSVGTHACARSGTPPEDRNGAKGAWKGRCRVHGEVGVPAPHWLPSCTRVDTPRGAWAAGHRASLRSPRACITCPTARARRACACT